MKTLQDCKDEVARLKYHGYKNWDDMSSELILRNHEGAKELLDRLEQAAELYAKAYHEDKTRWISAEKRLPEFGEPVFVWCRIYGRYIGTYQQIDGTRFGNWSDGKDLGVLPPLFWQPLPTPPKINAE